MKRRALWILKAVDVNLAAIHSLEHETLTPVAAHPTQRCP
jgi:hypothetical protein